MISYSVVNDLDSSKTLEHIRTLKPDIIVFAGGGILRKSLLDIPTLAVLNAHMGILPKHRGMNVAEWAALEGRPFGYVQGSSDARRVA